MSFFDTVGGQKIMGEIAHSLSEIARSLNEITKMLSESNVATDREACGQEITDCDRD